jgi:hypothetical protein
MFCVKVYFIEVYPMEVPNIGKGVVEVSGLPRRYLHWNIPSQIRERKIMFMYRSKKQKYVNTEDDSIRIKVKHTVHEDEENGSERR